MNTTTREEYSSTHAFQPSRLKLIDFLPRPGTSRLLFFFLNRAEINAKTLRCVALRRVDGLRERERVVHMDKQSRPSSTIQPTKKESGRICESRACLFPTQHPPLRKRKKKDPRPTPSLHGSPFFLSAAAAAAECPGHPIPSTPATPLRPQPRFIP
jgi:hypothetical protein